MSHNSFSPASQGLGYHENIRNSMLVVLSVSLLYNVADTNETLEKLSRTLLYACRSFPGLPPYSLFVAALLSKMDTLTGAVFRNLMDDTYSCGADGI